MDILFLGVTVKSVDFSPVFTMAHELFTHLSVACKYFFIDAGILMVDAADAMILVMNNGGVRSGGGSEHSVSDVLGLEVDELVEEAKIAGFETRKQSVLKGLVCQCHLTGRACRNSQSYG
jgi:hypothetical protein